MPLRILITGIMLLMFISCFVQQQPAKDTNRIISLLDSCHYYINKPGELPADLNTATWYARQAADLSIRMKQPFYAGKCFLLFSQAFREMGLTDKGKASLNKALSIFTASRLPGAQADAWMEAGAYCNNNDTTNINLRISYYKKAERLYEQAGETKKQADALKETADYYQLISHLPQSFMALKKALKLYQSVNYDHLQGVYDLIGRVAARTGEYKLGQHYGSLALKTAEAVHDTSMQLCMICNRLGVTSYDMGDIAGAEGYFRRALDIAMKYNSPWDIPIVSRNYVGALLRQKKISQAIAHLDYMQKKYGSSSDLDQIMTLSLYVRCYTTTRQFDLAAPYVQKMISLSEKAKTGSVFEYYRSLNQYYFATGQYREASKYALICEEICIKEYSSMGLADNYYFRFQADSAMGNYPAAIKYHQLHKRLMDSLFNESRNEQLALLLIQYETEKKEQDIQLLTRQGLLQKSELQKAGIIRNVTLAGIILLGIFAGLLYNRYYIKQQSNRKLEVKQKEINQQNLSLQALVKEKEWLLREIHHRVKNNLQIIMSLLNSQSAYLDNEAALLAIRNSQHRVQAISLIHQKLYQSDNMALIDMPVYIHELVAYLKDGFDTRQRIYFKVEIIPVKMDVVKAVPLGLILNEAITNTIKHAFPDNAVGTISISLQETAGNHFILTMTDNGIGLPPGFDPQQHTTLGISLMQGLAEDLYGRFTMESNGGTTITITFS